MTDDIERAVAQSRASANALAASVEGLGLGLLLAELALDDGFRFVILCVPDLKQTQLKLTCLHFPKKPVLFQGSLEECLRSAVNAVRLFRDKPTIEEEIKTEQKAEANHLEISKRGFGAKARCSCGSDRDLVVNLKGQGRLSWWSGQLKGPTLDACEISKSFQCLDCGRWYKLID